MIFPRGVGRSTEDADVTAGVGTWGADPTHLSWQDLGGSRAVVALVSVVIPPRSIPARTLPAPVLLSSPCVLSLSATLLNLGFGQQLEVCIYIHRSFIKISLCQRFLPIQHWYENQKKPKNSIWVSLEREWEREWARLVDLILRINNWEVIKAGI